MIEVKLERSWQTLGHEIWFILRDPLRVLYPVSIAERDTHGGGPMRWVPTTIENDTRGEVPPSLVLDDGMLEALLAEAEKVIPASHATERHLNREIAVSDRLLTIVERSVVQ